MALQNVMLDQLRANWGWIALRGAAAAVFGLAAFAWPGFTLVLLTIAWGAYALVDGAFALVAGFRLRDGGKPMWALILVGALGVGAGILTLLWPGMTALALLMFIAAWAIVTGIFQIVAAVRVRREIDNEWMLILSGALSVVFGVLMVLSPGAGALAVTWLIGAYAFVFGILLLILAFRLKGMNAAPAPTPGA
ncbi:MAG TPA: HdeD family acid-resistance protein [Burkholderiales bacterium]|nr:HdeD family acid-resistance protein [Burkholderiales bacterium]